MEEWASQAELAQARAEVRAEEEARRRLVLLSGGAIAAALLPGLGASLWLTVRAVAAEGRARQNAERAVANERTAKAERDAKDRALRAETDARQQAFAALRTMTDDVVERWLAAGQGHTLTDEDKAFLRGVIAQYDAFAATGGDDADARAIRAEGRARVGSVRYRLGELKEAEADYDAALALQKQLAADFPNRPEFRRELAAGHNNRGNSTRCGRARTSGDCSRNWGRRGSRTRFAPGGLTRWRVVNG